MTALLILPGLDGTATLHTAFIEAAAPLFDSVEVVPYPPDRPLGYAELEVISRAAFPEKPFVLLGESFSGPVALSIAADPPANLRGLVLSTTFATAPVPFLRTFAPLLHAVPFPLPPSMLLSWWLFGRWATPALEAALRDALRQVSPMCCVSAPPARCGATCWRDAPPSPCPCSICVPATTSCSSAIRAGR